MKRVSCARADVCRTRGCRWIGVGLAGGVSWVDPRALFIETGYTLLSAWVWLRYVRHHEPVVTQRSASS